MLTKREDQVLELLSHGLSAKQIGYKLFISPDTVRKTISNTKEKLDLHTSSELASFYWCKRLGSSYYEVRKMVLTIPCIVIIVVGGSASVRRSNARSFTSLRPRVRIEIQYHRENSQIIS